MRVLGKLSAAFIAASSFSIVFAGQVTFQGVQLDLGSGWRTPSITKTFDADGDNVLGTDGYILPNGMASLPTYFDSANESLSYYAGNSSYAKIDNPATTPGPSPTLVTSQVFNPPTGFGNPATLISFVLKTSATFRVGLLVDSLDSSYFNPISVFVNQNGNPSASASYTLSSGNGVPDWVFFDVSGSQGDTFNVGAVAGQSDYATLGAASFDTATPEPSTMFLLLAGTGMMIAGLNRRKTA